MFKTKQHKIHSHPSLEGKLGVPYDHCIVDREFVDGELSAPCLHPYGRSIAINDITREVAEEVSKEKKKLIQDCIELLYLNGYVVTKE